jgi:hypothetical protein
MMRKAGTVVGGFALLWLVLLVVGLILLGLTEAAQVQHVPAQVAIEQRQQQEQLANEYEESRRQESYARGPHPPYPTTDWQP